MSKMERPGREKVRRKRIRMPNERGKRRPLTVDDLLRLQRVSDPEISPDGKSIVYVVTTAKTLENRFTSNLWLSTTARIGTPRQLTDTDARDCRPRWAPDGATIMFESDRSGQNQLWLVDMTSGEIRQLTTIATAASHGIWSPDGKWIAFVSAVLPEYSCHGYAESNALNKHRRDATAQNPVKARTFKRLFFRHWSDWVEDKRRHLFVMPAPGSQRASESADEFMGEPRDVTPGDFDTHPTSETFSVGDECTFSPDSRFLVFTAPPEHNEAWSTNYNICRVSIDGGDVKCLTDGFPAANGAPRFSPDGKQFAFRTQRRAGFESDKWDIVVVDTHRDGQWKRKPQNVTSRFDMSVSEFTWTMRKGVPGLIVVAEQNGHKLLFRQERKDRFAPHRSIDRGTIECLTASRDGRSLAFLYATMDHPADVFLLAKDGMVNVSHVNDDLLAQLSLEVPQSVTVQGTDSTPMQMWILKPPQFNGEQKWPLVYLVHGGPHVAWKDGWSYRWNAQLWAAQGYIVALPNPRGSTGFGQKFVDEITGDWGGRCYDDLMSGIAYLEQQPYIDSERMAAAGSSFGGYMMNWFQGHTAKFKTLVTHGGIYNLESMYATTDELWFSEWNHSGLPWSNPGSYAKFSPHRFTRKFKTPMMIIHNDLDFRVSVSEGLQLFTTLQRLGIPSKMLNFPDEGHWVQKPANSEFWHREVFAWLAQYVTPGGKARAGGPVS